MVHQYLIKLEIQCTHLVLGVMTFNASAVIDSLLDPNNEYLDIIFSNGIYGDSQQLQTIQLNDFQISVNSNGGNASAVIFSLVNNSEIV